MVKLPVIDNCDDCGACCMDAGMPPFKDGELELLPEDIQVEVALYNAAGRQRGMPCAWLDCNMRCSRYEHRPKFCRDYEVGCHSCRTVRYQYGVDGGEEDD